MITLSALNDFTRVRHGFFTREGGVSQGLYASLNCGPGSKDEPAAVQENRARAMAMMDMPDVINPSALTFCGLAVTLSLSQPASCPLPCPPKT